MNAADTNILVRLMVRDDPLQAEGVGRFVESAVWISTVVLAEATWVVRSVYRRSASELAAGVEMLLGEKHVTPEDPSAVEAALELFRSRPVLKFSV